MLDRDLYTIPPDELLNVNVVSIMTGGIWRHGHPEKIDVDYMAATEDVLTSYELPYDTDYPQVCLDEKLVVLHADVVASMPMQSGLPERIDYQYERVGTANLFVMVERLAGYRHVEATEQCTAVDYFHKLKWLADVRYPHAKKIRLVDNLNTHRLASLYLAFSPEEALRLAQRFELHLTPVMVLG